MSERETIVAVICGLMLSACAPEPTIPMQTEAVPQATFERQSRFSVERVGVFADDLAYGSRRGIYIITDTKTGQQFVGVSGVGISEIGSHYNPSTKTTIRDER